LSSYRRSRQRNQAGRASPRLGRLLLSAGLLLLALWIFLSIVRLVNAARSLQEQQARVERVVEGGILNADGQELEDIVTTVRANVAEIKQVAGPFAGLGGGFGWLPTIGPLLADARPLLEMADAGSQIAASALDAFKPLLNDQAGAGDSSQDKPLSESLPQIASVLSESSEELRQADAAAERLLAARSDLEHESDYPSSISALLDRLDENAGLLHDGLKLAQAAPQLLGMDRPKTYLILAQNEDELRPSGGFISGAGRVIIDRGRVVNLTFDNANLVDDWQNKPYDQPPSPFTEFMGMDIFLFRDANFWPDFRTSAAQALALYSYGQDVNLDGVLAIDQQFMQQLLAAIGPLPVPDLGRIVDAANVVSQLREEWGPGVDNPNWIIERKAFMAPLAAAFLAQLEGGLPSGREFQLVETLQRTAQQRHLQLFAADPAVQTILDQTSWSGRMDVSGGGDFLHVSDANMGFNKVNAVVERSLAYRVNLDPDGGATAELDVHYSNPPSPEPVACVHGTRYDADTQYESLTSDCYWNYLRVYAPAGSRLTWSSENPVPEDELMSGAAWPGVARQAPSEGDSFAVFDNFLLLAPGQLAAVSFHYNLPSTVLRSEGDKRVYQLQIRKQAGTAGNTATIQVTLPPGAMLVAATPRPSTTSGNVLIFDLTLTSDGFISVTYE
jgi:hypothetical protein